MCDKELRVSTFKVDQRANFLALILLDALEDGKESDIFNILQRNDIDASFVPVERDISPLHYTCGMENAQLAVEIMKRLLQNCANPNVRSSENMTPLHVAAIFGRVEIVSLLLKHGADPNILDDERKTAMHYAIEECHFETLQAIRDHIFQDKYEQRTQRQRQQREETHIISRDISPQKDSINRLRFMPNENQEDNFAINGTPLNKTLLNVVNSEQRSELTPNSKYTPNKIHYNYDVTSPYYINITHRRHKPQPKFPAVISAYNNDNEKVESVDGNVHQDVSSEKEILSITTTRPQLSPKVADDPKSVNIFTLTKQNVEELSHATSNLDQSCTSMIEAWRERVRRSRARQSIMRQYDNINEMLDEFIQNEHLNFTNTVLRASEQSAQAPDEPEVKHLQKSNLSLGAIIQQAAQAHVMNSDDEPALESSYHTVPPFGELNAEENTKSSTEKKMQYNNIKGANDHFLQMTEAYVHTDDENGLVFYETKLLSNQPTAKIPIEQHNLNSTISTNVTIPIDYETDTLRKELTGFGDPPGPITKSTKRLYIKRLIKYKRKAPQFPELDQKRNKADCENARFSVELQRTVRSLEHFESIQLHMKYETQSASYFANYQKKQKMREGHLKQSFIYMLIDPRISCNLPGESLSLDSFSIWARFLHSIFYVGKGKTSRPYSHLYDAMKIHSRLHTKGNITKTVSEYCTNSINVRKVSMLRKQTTNLDQFRTTANNSPESKKLQRIIDIWRNGKGVVCLHVFHNIMPTDAYTREAAIIDALGLQHLTNMKRGDYYGPAQTWTMREKKYMGIALLYKAMQIYLAEGESQLSPSDLI